MSKKRLIDANAVRETFTHLGLSNKRNKKGFVAVARTFDGAATVLDKGAFVTFCKQFDANCMSLAAVQVWRVLGLRVCVEAVALWRVPGCVSDSNCTVCVCVLVGARRMCTPQVVAAQCIRTRTAW